MPYIRFYNEKFGQKISYRKVSLFVEFVPKKSHWNLIAGKFYIKKLTG
jgi:hypothetical protein